MTFSVLPLSADRTLVRTTWLVHEDAEEGVDYDVDTLTHVWRETNEQDSVFCARAQLGVSSPGYEPGPYAAERVPGRRLHHLVRRPGEGAPRAMTTTILGPRRRTSRPRVARRARRARWCAPRSTTSPTTCAASCCGRPSPAAYRFQPGQHLTLTVRVDGRAGQPLLHDRLLAPATRRADDHREARARRAGVELAARPPAAGRPRRRRRSARAVQHRAPPGRAVPLPLRRQRHHAADVDAAHDPRRPASRSTSSSCTTPAPRPTSSSATSCA